MYLGRVTYNNCKQESGSRYEFPLNISKFSLNWPKITRARKDPLNISNLFENFFGDKYIIEK